MIAAKDPAMNPQDFASVVEVDQTTILRLVDKGDLPETCGSSRSRFQGPDKQSWSQAPSFSPKGLGLTPRPGVEHPEAIEADYKRNNDMLVLETRAPCIGFALCRWAKERAHRTTQLKPRNTNAASRDKKQ